MGLLLLYRGLELFQTSHHVLTPVFLVGALFTGYIKHRFILSKTVRRLIQRIDSLPSPVTASQVYPPATLLVLAAMMSFSVLLRYLSLPCELQGFIKTAIGSALLHGAFLLFKVTYDKVSRVES